MMKTFQVVLTLILANIQRHSSCFTNTAHEVLPQQVTPSSASTGTLTDYHYCCDTWRRGLYCHVMHGRGIYCHVSHCTKFGLSSREDRGVFGGLSIYYSNIYKNISRKKLVIQPSYWLLFFLLAFFFYFHWVFFTP